MSSQDFDQLARAVAAPMSRRRALALAVGTTAAGAMAWLRPSRASAAACAGPTNAPCGAGATPCGPCCCKAGVACVNRSTGTCGCPAGTTPCGVACCQAGVACASPATGTCRGAVAACINGATPCGNQCGCQGPSVCTNPGSPCTSPGGGPCGPNSSCFCNPTVEGTGFCNPTLDCPSQTCSSSSDCPAGWACLAVAACCNGTNRCAPPCTT